MAYIFEWNGAKAAANERKHGVTFDEAASVFGDGLSIELTEDLSIASRTLDGRTVPFESLSGGTREQLSILLRLAAAMIVAPDGGVPLILDDALGYSDSSRLADMGAVLALAGRHCQVIVLTCFPERYRAVGGARVVELGRQPGERRG